MCFACGGLTEAVGVKRVRLCPLRVEDGICRNAERAAARRISVSAAVRFCIPAGKGVTGLLQIAAVCRSGYGCACTIGRGIRRNGAGGRTVGVIS